MVPKGGHSQHIFLSVQIFSSLFVFSFSWKTIKNARNYVCPYFLVTVNNFLYVTKKFCTDFETRENVNSDKKIRTALEIMWVSSSGLSMYVSLRSTNGKTFLVLSLKIQVELEMIPLDFTLTELIMLLKILPEGKGMVSLLENQINTWKVFRKRLREKK